MAKKTGVQKLKKDVFFAKMDRLGLELAYDDALLKTGHSEVGAGGAELTTMFSRNIPLKIPFVSAAMDTVTKSNMAIALAMLGGLGIIHRGMSPKDQAREVARVHYCLNGLIKKPICFRVTDTVEYILEMKEQKGYSFSGFPILGENGKLKGIVERDDFDFCSNPKIAVENIMLKKFAVAEKGISLTKALRLMQERKQKILPLSDNEGSLAGIYVLSDLKRILRASQSEEFKMYNLDKNGNLRVGAAVGTGEREIERVELLYKKGVDVIVIDTAHADTKTVIAMLKRIKKNYPIDVVVGNISTGESALRLVRAGADGIKVGQGPGSICTTRVVTGTGGPQLSAVYNCERAIRGLNIPIIADGGINYSGDVTKAIGAGAHCVMIGGLFAGTDEAPGEMKIIDGIPYKVYRGMGSLEAMKENKASRERYGQGDTEIDKLVPEGVEGKVPYKGGVKKTIYYLTGGLKSGMGSIGANDVEALRKKATFGRVTASGRNESHPHNLALIKEAPNYRV